MKIHLRSSQPSSLTWHLSDFTWSFVVSKELEVLDQSISVAMEILKTKTPTQCLLALVCPLYVVGRVARAEAQPFTRSVFGSKPFLAPGLKH